MLLTYIILNSQLWWGQYQPSLCVLVLLVLTLVLEITDSVYCIIAKASIKHMTTDVVTNKSRLEGTSNKQTNRKACGKRLDLATLDWDIINGGSEDNEQLGKFQVWCQERKWNPHLLSKNSFKAYVLVPYSVRYWNYKN